MAFSVRLCSCEARRAVVDPPTTRAERTAWPLTLDMDGYRVPPQPLADAGQEAWLLCVGPHLSCRVPAGHVGRSCGGQAGGGQAGRSCCNRQARVDGRDIYGRMRTSCHLPLDRDSGGATCRSS
jgi:hypothetical protein